MRRPVLRLTKRVIFQKQGEDRWEDQFSRQAAIRFLRGAEEVLAGRIAGRNTVVIYVRQSVLLKDVTSVWRIKGADGAVYDIGSLLPSEDSRLIEITCQTDGLR